MFFVLFFFWGKKPIKVQTKGVVNNSSQFNTSCFFSTKKSNLFDMLEQYQKFCAKNYHY